MKKNTFSMIDENGNEVVYDVLFTFENEETNKNYIVYTDNQKDESGNIEVYASPGREACACRNRDREALSRLQIIFGTLFRSEKELFTTSSLTKAGRYGYNRNHGKSVTQDAGGDFVEMYIHAPQGCGLRIGTG